MKEKLIKVTNDLVEQVEYYSDEIRFYTVWGIAMVGSTIAGLKLSAWWLKKVINAVLDERGV